MRDSGNRSEPYSKPRSPGDSKWSTFLLQHSSNEIRALEVRESLIVRKLSSQSEKREGRGASFVFWKRNNASHPRDLGRENISEEKGGFESQLIIM